MYVGEDVPLINLYTLATSTNAELKEITKKQRQVLVSQGTNPDVSLFQQDIAEPVADTSREVVETIKDTLDPVGSWFDTWKVPIGISAFAVGGMLLLGYSGLGTSVGKVVERRIK